MGEETKELPAAKATPLRLLPYACSSASLSSAHLKGQQCPRV